MFKYSDEEVKQNVDLAIKEIARLKAEKPVLHEYIVKQATLLTNTFPSVNDQIVKAEQLINIAMLSVVHGKLHTTVHEVLFLTVSQVSKILAKQS